MLESLSTAKFPNVVEADLFLRMRYETTFGIYDHDAPDNPEVPWPLLAMSPKESLSALDPLDFRLDQYAENQVMQIFGIPFDELIKFPRASFLKVIHSAKKHSSRMNASSSNVLKNLENLQAKLQTQAK